MASELGPINVDYRSPKITDDLTQAGAGVQEMQIQNLASQIGSRELSSQMGAANVASQIQDRAARTNLAERAEDRMGRSAQVEADYKYNLIDMNRARSAREDAKLPYELRGLEARNWVNQTIAHNNELKNELLDATMADQIEQSRAKTETDLHNLQQARMRTEAARRENQTYNDFMPALEEYWSGVANGTIDPETAPRPNLGGNRRLNELHDLKLDAHRERLTSKVATAQAVAEAKAEVETRATMTAEQRYAYDNAQPEDRARLMSKAKTTNSLLKILEQLGPEGVAYAGELREGRIDGITYEPVDGNFAAGSDSPIDINGNLTPKGIMLAQVKAKQIRAAQARAEIEVEAAKSAAKSGAGGRTRATEDQRSRWISDAADRYQKESGKKLDKDGLETDQYNMSREEANAKAIQEWKKINPPVVRAPMTSGGRSINSLPSQDAATVRAVHSDNATEKPTESLVVVASGRVSNEVGSKNVAVTSGRAANFFTDTDGQKFSTPDANAIKMALAKLKGLYDLSQTFKEKYKDTAWYRPDMPEHQRGRAYDVETGTFLGDIAGATIDGPDIDFNSVTNWSDDGRPSPDVHFSDMEAFGADWSEGSHHDSFEDAVNHVRAELNALVGAPKVERMLFDVFRPAPWAARAFKLKLPVQLTHDAFRGRVIQAYNRSSEKGEMGEYFLIKTHDKNGKPLTVSDMYKDAKTRGYRSPVFSFIHYGTDGAPLDSSTVQSTMTFEQAKSHVGGRLHDPKKSKK